MFTKRFSALLWVALAALGGAARAQLMPIMPNVGTPQDGPMNLPFMTTDNAGSMWCIYGDGALRQQMGPAVFAQGGMLTIDGNNFNVPNNQGNFQTKTNELILQNDQMNGLSVTRRIMFDKENGSVRYLDVLHNSDTHDRTVTVGIQTILNWGIQQSRLVPDPKHKDQNLAWVGMTGMGRSVLEIYGGAGGAVEPTINYQNGANVIQANYGLTIPAGKDAALMHLHLFVPSLDAGVKWAGDLNVTKLLHNVPPPLRRQIVNFAHGQSWLEDVEILRGDVFDVVELRGGDVIKGTLEEPAYNLDTFYGSIQLSPTRVVALINVGTVRPRQLVVADDGEIFGGRLAKQSIDLMLTSGQTVQIPLDQIARVGYRKRPDEPEEWTFDKPMVLLRGGDRLVVQTPGQNIEAATRCGVLSLDPATVAAVAFQSEDSTIDEIYLTDGSKLTGLLSATDLAMTLAGAGPDQMAHFPISALTRLQLGKAADADSDSPSLALADQDVLVGSLAGQFKLQTAFDTITIDGPQVRHLTRNDSDLQIMLWDGSTLSGQISDVTVQCQLLSGPVLNVPVSLLSEYNQPHPMPSPDVIKQIEAAVADLNADDWRQRDRAEANLASMGNIIIGVLHDLRAKQPPEAQQRIDAIIRKLQSQPARPSVPGASITPQDVPGIMNMAIPMIHG